MLDKNKVIQAIQKKSPMIQSMQIENIRALEIYNQQIQTISSSSYNYEVFNEMVLVDSEKFIGALATDELTKGIVHKSIECEIQSPEMANQWKKNILSKRIVIATDGSQIEPDKNLNLFIGAVQSGWFINFHDEENAPIKDISFELVLPSLNTSFEEQEFRKEIAFRRFQKEIDSLIDGIKYIAKRREEMQITKIPIAFFDGSLTLSFIQSERRKRDYLQIVSELLQVSEKYKIPVIGYIDTSLAFNVIKSMEKVFQINTNGNISDAGLFNGILQKWGERSAFFKYLDQDNTVMSQIGFCYLKASSQKKPVRLEIPLWVFKEGLLDETVNVAIAQCLVGNGYPYVIEVADSLAVIQKPERELFFKYLNQYGNLKINESLKQKSKIARRKPSLIV